MCAIRVSLLLVPPLCFCLCGYHDRLFSIFRSSSLFICCSFFYCSVAFVVVVEFVVDRHFRLAVSVIRIDSLSPWLRCLCSSYTSSSAFMRSARLFCEHLRRQMDFLLLLSCRMFTIAVSISLIWFSYLLLIIPVPFSKKFKSKWCGVLVFGSRSFHSSYFFPFGGLLFRYALYTYCTYRF